VTCWGDARPRAGAADRTGTCPPYRHGRAALSAPHGRSRLSWRRRLGRPTSGCLQPSDGSTRPARRANDRISTGGGSRCARALRRGR